MTIIPGDLVVYARSLRAFQHSSVFLVIAVLEDHVILFDACAGTIDEVDYDALGDSYVTIDDPLAV